MQGILFPDGRVYLGIDVWRQLLKYDFPSHPIREFESIKKLKIEYRLAPVRRTNILYLNGDKEEREEWILV